MKTKLCAPRSRNSKIIYGNIKDTVDEFIKIKPKTISCIFFDMDLYSSTLDFLNQIPKLSEFLLPRVLCYFDDLYTVYNYNGQCNGELKAIDDFNKQDLDFKLSYSIDHIHSFKFPLAKSTILTMIKQFLIKYIFSMIIPPMDLEIRQKNLIGL